MSITDFGRKIGGARKDLWVSSGGLTIDFLSDMTSEEKEKYVKKDEIWLKPDYTEMVHNGVSREAAYFQQKMRVATNPKPAYGNAANYVKAVTEIRDAVEKVKTANDIDNFFKGVYMPAFINHAGYRYIVKEGYNEAIGNKLFKTAQMGSRKAKTEAYTKHFAMTPEEAADYDVACLYKIYTYDGDKIKLEQDYNGRNYISIKNGCSTTYYYDGATMEMAVKGSSFIIEGRKIILKNLNMEEAASRLEELRSVKKAEMLSNDTKKAVTARKKKWPSVTVNGIIRKGRDYVSELHQKKGTVFTESNNGQLTFVFDVPLESEESHATGDDYLNTFGFYGGEFGNWMTEKDREASLDYGFNAFKDLAMALGIADESISFDGHLAIAFGARGHGKAAAHYEPLRRVINLTKMSGAGALAHEWGHALDHAAGIFYEVKGSNFASESADAKHFLKSPTKLPEVYKKIDAILTDPNGRYYKDSSTFGGIFTNMGQGYWNSQCEMFARAFDCYIVDKLKAMGVRSDYLTSKAESFKTEYSKGMVYAYPIGDEREQLNKLFNELIEKFKEDGLIKKSIPVGT